VNIAFTYGRSGDFKYAIAAGFNRSHGVWDACEVDGELYRVIEFDEIPECDWDRIGFLEDKCKLTETPGT
jgi:hypothetical protein